MIPPEQIQREYASRNSFIPRNQRGRRFLGYFNRFLHRIGGCLYLPQEIMTRNAQPCCARQNNTAALYSRNCNASDDLRYSPKYLGECIKINLLNSGSMSYMIAIANLFNITFYDISEHLRFMSSGKDLGLYPLALSDLERYRAFYIADNIDSIFNREYGHREFPIKPREVEHLDLLNDAQCCRAEFFKDAELKSYRDLLNVLMEGNNEYDELEMHSVLGISGSDVM